MDDAPPVKEFTCVVPLANDCGTKRSGATNNTTRRSAFLFNWILAQCHLIADTTNFYFNSMTEIQKMPSLEARVVFAEYLGLYKHYQ